MANFSVQTLAQIIRGNISFTESYREYGEYLCSAANKQNWIYVLVFKKAHKVRLVFK